MIATPFGRRIAISSLHAIFFLVILYACASAGRSFEIIGLTGAVEHHVFLSRSACGLLVVFLIPLTFSDDGMPSDFFLHLLVLLILSPSMVLFAAKGSNFHFVATSILSCLAVIQMSKMTISLRMRPIVSANAALWVLSSLTALYFASLIYYEQYKFFNLNPLLVYDFRREAAENLPPVYGYLLSWVAKVIIPAGLALAIYMRRIAPFAILFLASVGVFALASHKGPLLYPFIVLAVYLFSGRREALPNFLLLAVLGAIILAFDAKQLALQADGGQPTYPGGGIMASYILRRAIMVPSFLNECYLNFFGGAGIPYWWSDSRVSFNLLTPPYEVSPPFKIGEVCFGRHDMSANAGWIGSGYANGLFLGSILYSGLLGVLLATVNATVRNNSRATISAMVALPLLTLITSSDLFTALLTHGVLLAMVVAMMVNVPARGAPE